MRPNPILAYKMTMTADNNKDKKLQRDVREEDEILELDADKVELVANTFGKVQLYLRSDTNRGYAKLNAPGHYSFRMPEYPNGDPESITHNEDNDPRLLDSWTNEIVQEIDMTRKEDVPLLGRIQRDEVTGELYIMMPLEVDVLLQSALPGEAFELATALAARDSTMTIIDMDADDKNASQTTLTDNIQPAISEQEDEAETGILCEYEVCRFVVPQLSLNFKLTLHVGDPNEDDVDTNDEDADETGDDNDDDDNDVDEDGDGDEDKKDKENDNNDQDDCHNDDEYECHASGEYFPMLLISALGPKSMSQIPL